MATNINLKEVISHFPIDQTIESYGNGHINDTYLCGQPPYILQRINTNIFKNPVELMENIDNVTAFLRKKIAAAGGNPDRETLTVIKTHEGDNFYKYDDNNCFRVYKFITDTVAIETGEDLQILFNAGKGFGRFQNMLDDFPVEVLHETIVDFHNTPKRVENLKAAIKADKAGRAHLVQKEIEFALECAEFSDVVVKGIADGSIPMRVTHNDTKINNILFDDQTHEPLCVIDLDTVMQGSLLYDFGDALRIGASSAAEDEEDLDKVWFDEKLFEAFAKGFLEFMGKDITPREKELLSFSAKLLTYECGIRFLTDYLNGDTYFKIHKPAHNLIRARNQFKLVKDIEDKMDELNEIIANL